MRNKQYILFTILALFFLGCKQNDYYIDGGTSGQTPEQQSLSTYELLKQNKDNKFDSLIKIIDLTNSKEIINAPNITLFAAGNPSIIRFQQSLTLVDQESIALNKIEISTLQMLLKRFIIPNNRILLEDFIPERKLFLEDLHRDSIQINGTGGKLIKDSNNPSSAYKLEYTHIKIKNLDTISYKADIQTHNLKSANAIIHVITDNGNFGCGLKVLNYKNN